MIDAMNQHYSSELLCLYATPSRWRQHGWHEAGHSYRRDELSSLDVSRRAFLMVSVAELRLHAPPRISVTDRVNHPILVTLLHHVILAETHQLLVRFLWKHETQRCVQLSFLSAETSDGCAWLAGCGT